MDTSKNDLTPGPPNPQGKYNWPEWAVWIVSTIKRLLGCVDALDAKVDEHDKCLAKLKAAADHHPVSCPAGATKEAVLREMFAIKEELVQKVNDEITDRKLLARDFFWKTSIIGLISGAIPPTVLLIVLAIRWFLSRGTP